MTDDRKPRFGKVWEELHREWTAAKEPNVATVAILSYYRGLPPGERESADAEISAWLLSEDGGQRFDAMALVEDFRIAKAVPNLLELARRLRGREGPEARYELEKAEQILRQFDEPR